MESLLTIQPIVTRLPLPQWRRTKYQCCLWSVHKAQSSSWENEQRDPARKAMQSHTIEETRRHMNSLYPDFAAAHSKLKLNPKNVPERFWPWIPYAEL
jgi:hypothetical protein